MSSVEASALEREWVVLQGNIEQHERNALVVKLVAVFLFTAAVLFSLAGDLTAWLIAILWVQEAMLRTFQARMGTRILRIEEMLRGAAGQAMQLHTDWIATRKGLAGMVFEYAASAIRPTVAFPYAVLLLVDLVFLGGSAGMEASAT
jgi:hypothetical protein